MEEKAISPQPNLPVGNCTPSTVFTVSLNVSPASQVQTNTRVQLSGVSQEEHRLANCEITEKQALFDWTLTFQPPGGTETNADGLLLSSNTLDPFFVPASEGTYRVTLVGESTTLGQKTARATITVVSPPPVLLNAQGKLTFLRVHDFGTGFGPPTDFIDVEAVVQLNTQPGKSFGFQLRNDKNRPARQGMLDLMRDAFENNVTVSIDFFIVPGKNNGVIIRTALLK
ncbi:MAG: hypothetical protein C5B51_04850 [Terriglobia bacterium]|nr:MAG: hypothetical protein C5B51_04850 [Terriglobia bacterium]